MDVYRACSWQQDMVVNQRMGNVLRHARWRHCGRIRRVCSTFIRRWRLFFSAFGRNMLKKKRKQLSVTGMSLRIWDVIAQFIDAEAKTGDYINCSFSWLFKPPVVSSFSFLFFFFHKYQANTTDPAEISKHAADLSFDPLKGKVGNLQKSILIAFFFFIDTPLRELDPLQNSDRLQKVSRLLFGTFRWSKNVHRDVAKFHEHCLRKWSKCQHAPPPPSFHR